MKELRKIKNPWLDTLHGGIQSMLLDEVAGGGVTRTLQTTGVTSKMEVRH